jgi:hypothetical protein
MVVNELAGYTECRGSVNNRLAPGWILKLGPIPKLGPISNPKFG